MVTADTKNALQIIYFHLELDDHERYSIMNDLKDFFILHHGGEASALLV
jgi:DNA/RNA-binding domain of Phe-tRNA-synthetase-like protein